MAVNRSILLEFYSGKESKASQPFVPGDDFSQECALKGMRYYER